MSARTCYWCRMNTTVSPIARNRPAVYKVTNGRPLNPEASGEHRFVCGIHLATGVRSAFLGDFVDRVTVERAS